MILAFTTRYFCNAKVEQLGHVFAAWTDGDKNIFGLHIPVRDALGVSRRQAMTGLDRDLSERVGRNRSFD